MVIVIGVCQLGTKAVFALKYMYEKLTKCLNFT